MTLSGLHIPWRNVLVGYDLNVRRIFSRHPEYLVWLVSLFFWIWIYVEAINYPDAGTGSSTMYCGSSGIQYHGGNLFSEQAAIITGQEVILTYLESLPEFLKHWIIMLVVMMFPLLKEPVRHVAFSLPRARRILGVAFFLVGYTAIWTLAGFLFLGSSVVLELLAGPQEPLLHNLLIAGFFLIAGIVFYSPVRPVVMAKCNRTISIRIERYYAHADAAYFGVRMARTCFMMCWAPMAALMIYGHSFLLMIAITFVLICERYLLPHTNKLPAYMWGITCLVVLCTEMFATFK